LYSVQSGPPHPKTHEGPSKPEPTASVRGSDEPPAKADPPIIPDDNTDPSKAVPSDWASKPKQP